MNINRVHEASIQQPPGEWQSADLAYVDSDSQNAERRSTITTSGYNPCTGTDRNIAVHRAL